jgi:Undecaprenyl-phosphate galactose phosphotransferase WbaP
MLDIRMRENLRNRGWIARAFASSALGLTDLAAVILCFLAVCAFFPHPSFVDYFSFLSQYFQFVPLFVVSFIAFGLYPGLSLAPAEELRRFTLSSLVANIISIAMTTGLQWHADRDGAVFPLVWLVSIPMLTACRVISRALISHSTLWGVPAVVFGTSREARAIVDRLLRYRWIGYTPKLILEDDGKKATLYKGIPVISDLPRGFELARACGYSVALVSLAAVRHSREKDLIRRYMTRFPTFIVFSDFVGLVGVWSAVRDFEGIIGLSKKQKLLVPRNAAAKRVIDILVVTFGGMAILPFIVLLTLLVKLGSPGPAFYRHRRLGKGGREIFVWKFRSMVADADARLAECFETNPASRKEWSANHKLKNDPRITRIGRFLRRSSLDELPQILNVLKGEMSLVGPRPIVHQEVKHYRSAWDAVSSVLPGMTGLWQVSGRSEAGYHQRVEQDLYYIQNWSIWLDLYILFKTIWKVISGNGAY